ncbi:hypothetical protein ALON55S_02660 [Alishewanella longhuensis]
MLMTTYIKRSKPRRVRTNSRGELIGLSHRGWFAEYSG